MPDLFRFRYRHSIRMREIDECAHTGGGLALDPRPTAMKLHQTAYERQSEARAPGLPVVPVVDLVERREYSLEKLAGNARAVVLHANLITLVRGTPSGHLD